MPSASWYGVPAVAHVTDLPSPISQSVLATLAEIVTVTDPSDAVFDAGPYVCASGASTHIHTGIPTSPTYPGLSSGTIPILIGRSWRATTAFSARTAGSTETTPIGTVGDQKTEITNPFFAALGVAHR